MKKLLILLFLVVFVIGCSNQVQIEPTDTTVKSTTTTTVKVTLTPIRISCEDDECMEEEEDKILAKLLSTFHNDCEPARYYVFDFSYSPTIDMEATVKIQRNGNICNYLSQYIRQEDGKPTITESLICEFPLSALSEITAEDGPTESSPYCWKE